MRLVPICCLLVLSLGMRTSQESYGVTEEPVRMEVPKKDLAFDIGPHESNRTMMVFMDHLCSACASDWPIISTYFNANLHWLRVEYHFIPLPYHHNSFVVQQAGRFIQNKYPIFFLNYTTWMFENQDEYLSATNMT